MTKSFQLDPEEVTWRGGWSNSGRRKARFSRAAGLSSADFTLTHQPTGVSVSGEVPGGNYTRNEMKALKQELFEKLWLELTDAVAGKLRAPGR